MYKEEQLVKNLVVFLLSGFLLFSARVAAQTENCLEFSPLLRGYTTDFHGNISVTIIYDLEDGQNCLNENLRKLKSRIEFLQSVLISNGDLEHDILNLQDKLKEAEHDLQTNRHALLAAETKIEALEDRLNLLEYEKARPLPHPASSNAAASKPKAPASKPKAPVNQAKPVDSPKDR